MDEGRFPCACTGVRKGTGLLSSELSFMERGKESVRCSRGGRLLLHAGSIHSDEDCLGEITIRTFTRCCGS